MTVLPVNSPAAAGEDQYLQEIRRIPLLTPQQERDLAMGCARGDQEAIRRMVSANLRLVVSIAREYAGRGVPLMDLVQEGSIGLLAAARKFDYTMENRFSTYATKWIRQGIHKYLENHSQLIRVPVHTADRLRKLTQARESLRAAQDGEPTVEQLAEFCGIPAEKVQQLLSLQPQLVSLDAEETAGIHLEDLQTLQPQEALVRDELSRTLTQLLSRLDDRQEQVLRLHFGMDGECCSLEEIGRHLGISKERVRQIEKQAIEQLKKMGADIGLEDFLA